MGWLHWRSAPTQRPLPLPAHGLAELRMLSIAVLDDCSGPASDRLRVRLAHAGTAQDLWLLRGDVYQEVARAHCQPEACRRINALLPAFQGWLPAEALGRV